ncbi:TnsA endonuclease N-terminal domain-containing protein [Sporosarcina sp. ACRSM]|uniref:TnsA endonuclease N-terminal domain-containing protein n=1 Tax=Sporosarcina sp. ACRSM TaxID=2918216 RepID=UPI001EF6C5D5|nr:TnsA endonuclease N-terminal domain-containing protein [Sporosarcina sp. ACRSM]MCG7334439.1 TnsA endonuclease N-terminal domain-containing protein [Sporosarcina sp. ACRSM]
MYTPIITNFSTKYGNNRWKSKSLKIGRDVFLSSDLEYDNWLFIECNPHVISYCEQPFEIKLPMENTIRSSIPNMWILYDDGTEEIREIKYSNDLQENRVLTKIEIQQKWCEKNDLVHKVVTEKDLRLNRFLLTNYKIIISLLKSGKYLNEAIRSDILDQVKRDKKTSIHKLLNISSGLMVENLFSNIALLIFMGELYADLDCNYFGINSEVYLIND